LALFILAIFHSSNILINITLMLNDQLRHIYLVFYHANILEIPKVERGRCGRDRMVVGFTTTYVIIVYHH